MRASLQQVFDKIEAHGFQIADFREERTHSGGPGGQNVNKVETCFCVTHLPTGLRVRCESERSQSANRAKAWHGILEKLLQQRQQIIREKKNLLEKKRRQSRPRPNSVKREFKKLKKRRKEIKSNRSAVSRDPV